MKNRKLRHTVALIGLTMLIFSLSCVVGVKAGTIGSTLEHKTPITFEFTNNPVHGVFEKEWITKGGIYHARGYDHIGVVEGGLEGTLTYVGDINLNLETFDGTGGGTVCFDVGYGDLSGTFEGRMVIKVYMTQYGPYIDAKFICHGADDFDGMHLKGTAGGFMGFTYFADAVILNPYA